VLAVILQHVDERVPDFPRRSERPLVISVREHTTSPDEPPIDCFGDPDGEPLHALREGLSSFGLDDEMQMVRLDAEVCDSKRHPAGRGNRTSNAREDIGIAQRAEFLDDS